MINVRPLPICVFGMIVWVSVMIYDSYIMNKLDLEYDLLQLAEELELCNNTDECSMPTVFDIVERVLVKMKKFDLFTYQYEGSKLINVLCNKSIQN